MTTRPEMRRAAGFALVSAIFLLVGLAALGAFAVSVGTTQHAGSALDVTGVRAYYAARAGSEWGAAKTADAAFCAPNDSSNLGSFNGVSVSVACTRIAAGDAVELGLGRIHSITTTACTHPLAGACPGSADATTYVERRVTILVER